MNSKELLEQTGISRATLNNYIALGIVPRPEVLPPEPQDGAAPRIGYFPEDTVRRIAEIQRLKNEGWSMSRIAAHFGAGQPIPEADAAPAGAVAGPLPAQRPLPRLPIEDIAHPAYLVDHGFDILWLNAAAGAGVLALPASGLAEASQNVFKYLLHSQAANEASREQVLKFHLALARQHGASASRVGRDLTPPEQDQLQRLYHQVERPEPALVSHIAVPGPGAAPETCVYAVQCREGLLFVHVPRGQASEELSSQLAARELAVGDLARKRLPVLRDVAVLVTDLQHATRIWSSLPAEEYFELVNQIWLRADPIFRRHHGTHGKHAGDGMVCYFLPQREGSYLWNALVAAHEMRQAMHQISKHWQLRKGWSTELHMNTGLDEGQQWLGTLKAAGQVEFTMFGDALNRAARISDFAESGAIWATKNLVARLSADERQRLTYGVRGMGSAGREQLVPAVFSSVDRLADLTAGAGTRLQAIAGLPIAEIVDVADAPRPRERAPGQQPT